jgi:hypothetical protein
MNRKWAHGAIAALVLTLAVGTHAWGQERATPKPKDAGPAATAAEPSADQADKDTAELAAVAIKRAAKANKYMFVLAYRTEDEPTKAARKILAAVMEKCADRALSTTVSVTDPLERGFVGEYGLNRAPTPLVLAIAPNGAVTRSFAEPLDEAQFDTAFVSPCTQKSLKALQERKLVFICVQNDQTQHNAEAMKGVREFAAEANFAKTTEIIPLDPADAAEENFLKQLKVDPKTAEAVTVFMAPPGATVASYTGETKKDVLVAAAKKAAKGCDPKSGCCPAPKKPANPPAQPPGQPQPQQPGSAEKKL